MANARANSNRIVIAVRCHYCSRQLAPSEVIVHANGVRMCLQCREWHARALLLIGGSPPPGCQECGLTFEQVAAVYGGVNVRFVAVPKDGIYQVLCGACADAYVPKRRDLVEGTEFGNRL